MLGSAHPTESIPFVGSRRPRRVAAPACFKGAPLRRAQAQIRHKRCPTATPIYSVLSLSSPPLRAERVTVFCFRLFRSLVPRSQKSKIKMGWKTQPNFFKIGCANPLAIGQAVGYWTVRRGRRVGHIASIGLPITNHFSPIIHSTRYAYPAQASHLSPFTNPLPLSLLTNHFSRSR